LSATARACPNCSTPLPAYAAFCYKCGAATPAGIDRATGEYVVPETSGITMDEVLLKLRRVLGPTYELGARIGAGGFAEVFVARDLRLKREVAVKVTRPDFAVNAQMMQRFRREAEVIAALRHPHIMPIYDIGEADGIAYIVMPYVRGESLKARLDREEKLPVELARRILLQVGDALHNAHEAGVVHRDVKPDNVMLDRREDQVLLMDFGIAKAAEAGGLDGTASSLTSTGLVMGTPHYMSPEQAAGERTIDARSDQYALAVVGYRMIAGVLPFDGPSVRAILAKQLVGAATPLRRAAPDAPPALAAAIERAMAKDPEDRYPSVKAFLDAVRSDPSYAAEVLKTTGGVPPYTPQQAVDAPPAGVASTGRGRALVALAVLAAVGVGAALYARDGGDSATRAALAADSTIAAPPAPGVPAAVANTVAAGTVAAPAGTRAAAVDSTRPSAAPPDSLAAADTAAARLRADSAALRRVRLAIGTPAAEAHLRGLALLRRRTCEALAADPRRAADAALACAAQQRLTPDRPAVLRTLGTLADRANRPDSAAVWYQQASDKGDPESTERLARMYEQGRGVTVDLGRSVALLRRAADGGQVDAQRELAVRYARGVPGVLRRDEGSAASWYTLAAGSGDVASMRALGDIYENGRGVRKNESEAVGWWQKAAAAGDTASQYDLGMAYLRGRGVAKSDSAAMYWLARLAALGHPGGRYEAEKLERRGVRRPPQ
jgi:serine/threonine-protein kinase